MLEKPGRRGGNQVGSGEAERAHPVAGQACYPHLADVREGLRDVLGDARGVWLDFGAAASPYRDLFAAAELRTADMAADMAAGSTGGYVNYGAGQHVDYPLTDDGLCPAPDRTFDGVLSTFVLEHAVEPERHLDEAFRLLRPGGRLVLATHGTWEDHLKPDLWRWTADGLSSQVRASGFVVDGCWTLTSELRAILTLLLLQNRRGRWPGAGPVPLLLNAVRMAYRRWPAAFDRYADRRLADRRRPAAGSHRLYLALLVAAHRP